MVVWKSMFFLKWLLGAKNDSEFFSKGVELFVRIGGNRLLYPSITNQVADFMQFNQDYLESFVPGISQNQYSKLLHGIRFALKHMIDDKPFQPGDIGSLWRIDVLELQDFLNRISRQQEILAFMPDNTTRISLPKIKFSSKKSEYFQELHPEQKFNLHDATVSQQPIWVLRLKKIWNLLFLSEELFQIIETEPKNLLHPENLRKFNEAYQLLFELDIDLLGLLQKIMRNLEHIYQHYFPQFFKDEKHPTVLAKDMGYYLGLIISRMGAARGLIDFGFQAKQLSPQVLAWLSSIMNNLVEYVSTKSKILVESKQIEKLEKNIKKIKVEMKDFEKNPESYEKNIIELLVEILQFIHKPNRHKVLRLIRHMAVEHETFVMEVLRWLKYEAIPFGLGFFEDLENQLMLEPGFLMTPLEVFAQQSYHIFIDFLDFKKNHDLKNLYSQNWFIIREENAYQKWAMLLQQKEQLNVLRKNLNASNVLPLHKFKLLYEYLVWVDSNQAEKLRQNFEISVWDSCKSLIENRLISHITQIDNQLYSLEQYLQKHQHVKHHSVAYFELSSSSKITYQDLSEDQKSHCRHFHEHAEKISVIQRFILEIKKEKLQEKLSLPHQRTFWVAPTLLVLFQNEHFLVHIENGEIQDIEIKSHLNLGFAPAKNQPIFLSGYMIEKLGLTPSGKLTLFEDIPRYTFEIDKRFTPANQSLGFEELEADELSRYAEGLYLQCKKIEKCQERLNALLDLLNKPSPCVHLIRSQYFELRGLFKALDPKRFEKFDQQFLTNHYQHADLVKICSDNQNILGNRLQENQNRLKAILVHYENRYKEEKINRKLEPHERAPYLMHTKHYSTAILEVMQKFHTWIQVYISPALLGQLGVISADKSLNVQQKDNSNLAIKAIIYIHNVLFHLKNFYVAIEQNRKYSEENLSSNIELGHRIHVIANYFGFQNLVLGHFPLDFSQQNEWLMLLNIKHYFSSLNERYSNVYSLKEGSEYSFLNSSIISQQIITHLFENKAIRDYVLASRYGESVEKLAQRLAKTRHLPNAYKHMIKYDFFRDYRLDLIYFRLGCLKQKKKLAELSQAIKNDNKAKNKLKFIVCHSQLKQIQAIILQKQNQFHQFLKKRDQIFFRILEKNIQNLTYELTPVEQILSSAFFARPFTLKQQNHLQELQKKQSDYLETKRKIAELAADMSKLTQNWETINQQFNEIKMDYLKFSEVDKWLFDLLKKIIHQTSHQTFPSLDQNEKLSVNMIISGKANVNLVLKKLLEQLIIFKDDEYVFNKHVLTVKHKIIKKMLQRYYRQHHEEFHVYENELLIKFSDDKDLGLLVEFKNDRYFLRSYELPIQEQWILDCISSSQAMYDLPQPLETLSIEQLFRLWPIQSALMRQEMFLAIQEQKSDLQLSFEKTIKQHLYAPLKSLELLFFRAQYLKEAHQQSRDMMQLYAYIDQKKFLYQLRYLTFSPLFMDFLRKGLQTFRKKCDENISNISDEIISPLLIRIDQFEISCSLRPGILSFMAEHYLMDFCLSFAQQLSNSSLYVPMMIERYPLIQEKRILQIEQDIREHKLSNDQSCVIHYLQSNLKPLNLQIYLYKHFIDYTKRYVNVLQARYHVITHPRLQEDEKLYQFFKFYVDKKIQCRQNSGFLKHDLYQMFLPYLEAGTQDVFFNSYCSSMFQSYLQKNLHFIKKLNNLAYVLDEFENGLLKVKSELIEQEKQFEMQPKDWSSWFYRVFVKLPNYYLMTLFYYRYHQLGVIEEKLKQISTLKTCIYSKDVEEVKNIIKNFTQLIEEQYIQNNLPKRTFPAWHLFYLLIEIITFFIDLMMGLYNFFVFPSLQIYMTQDEYYFDKIKQILKAHSQDEKFEYPESIHLLFKPKSDLSAADFQLLRKT